MGALLRELWYANGIDIILFVCISIFIAGGFWLANNPRKGIRLKVIIIGSSLALALYIIFFYDTI